MKIMLNKKCRHESIRKKKYYAGVPTSGVTQVFFTPNNLWDKVKEVIRPYLNVPFSFALPIFESLFGGSVI